MKENEKHAEDNVWLVHKTGFTSAVRLPENNAANLSQSERCLVKLNHSNTYVQAKTCDLHEVCLFSYFNFVFVLCEWTIIVIDFCTTRLCPALSPGHTGYLTVVSFTCYAFCFTISVFSFFQLASYWLQVQITVSTTSPLKTFLYHDLMWKFMYVVAQERI